MFHFKTISLIAILISISASCNQQKLKLKQEQQDRSAKNRRGLNKINQLVPYLDVYEFNAPLDTILPNGTYILYLVNQDTSDLTLYMKYGNKKFDSVYVMEHGLELPPCHRYEVCYATEETLAVVYQCMNSRGLTLLPLTKSKPIIEQLNPLFIGVEQGFTISLMDEDNDFHKGDSLLVADLDFKRKQYIKINKLVCGDRIQCFDNVKVRDNKVYLTYTGAVSDVGPQTINQVEILKLDTKL